MSTRPTVFFLTLIWFVAARAPLIQCPAALKTLTVNQITQFACAKNEKVGNGMSATAFWLQDTQTRENVLLKVQETFSLAEKAKAEQEYKFLKKLDHPNIIKAKGTVYWPEKRYFATLLQFADLGSLGSWIKKQQAITTTARETIGFMIQLFKGFEYLHKQKIIHADVKPDNIVIGKDKNPLIIDFDLSVTSGEYASPRGTPLFMAPEILMEKYQTFLPSADVYSLGAVLYEMLFYQVPFTANTLPELKTAVTKGLIKINKDTDVMVAYLILSCLNFSPQKRGKLADLIATAENYLKGKKFWNLRVTRSFSNRDIWTFDEFFKEYAGSQVTYPGDEPEMVEPVVERIEEPVIQLPRANDVNRNPNTKMPNGPYQKPTRVVHPKTEPMVKNAEPKKLPTAEPVQNDENLTLEELIQKYPGRYKVIRTDTRPYQHPKIGATPVDTKKDVAKDRDLPNQNAIIPEPTLARGNNLDTKDTKQPPKRNFSLDPRPKNEVKVNQPFVGKIKDPEPFGGLGVAVPNLANSNPSISKVQPPQDVRPIDQPTHRIWDPRVLKFAAQNKEKVRQVMEKIGNPPNQGQEMSTAIMLDPSKIHTNARPKKLIFANAQAPGAIFTKNQGLPGNVKIITGYPVSPQYTNKKRNLALEVTQPKQSDNLNPSPSSGINLRQVVMLLIFVFVVMVPSLVFVFCRISGHKKQVLTALDSASTDPQAAPKELAFADQQLDSRVSETN